MARRLPPLNSLRAFEAAARHLSFTRAAEELHVTPAAISQQVKTLEDYAGARLFRRLTRALMLTDAGQAALPALSAGFDQLEQAFALISAHQDDGVLTVSVAPSFGAKWLVPRLEGFRSAWPDFDIRLDATDNLVDFDRGDADIALRYGGGDYPGLKADCLIAETAFPVCSPALLEGERPLLTLDDLRHHTLLHIQWKMEAEFAPNWKMWLRAAGLTDIDATRGPRFSMDSFAVQAAISGQGVALGTTALVEDDLAEGRLVRPFGNDFEATTQFGYYVVYPEATADQPKVKAFREWVLSEATCTPTLQAEDAGL